MKTRYEQNRLTARAEQSLRRRTVSCLRDFGWSAFMHVDNTKHIPQGTAILNANYIEIGYRKKRELAG